MQEPAIQAGNGRPRADLSREEQRSLTHGEFWIPEEERNLYREALQALNRAAVPYVVSGLYAVYEYTGIYRKTKDLDLFFEPRHVIDAARVVKDIGFQVWLEDPHWLAKAVREDRQIDLIFGMGNGLAPIDEAWYRHSRAGILAATQVRVAPPEELLYHRLYVSERHRHDMADVLHLILCRGDELDWDRLIARLGDHYRLLLAHVHLFDFVYPGYISRIPHRVRDGLVERARAERGSTGDPLLCQGTLISRFSFNIDVNEWGFHDPRRAATEAMCGLPVFEAIRKSDVWEE